MRLRALLAVALALLAPIPAQAMSRGSPPNKQGVPWANGAGPSYIRTIPTNSQIGITNCAASYTDGFPPLTFLPASAGGCPPFGQDMNGILNALSLALQWAMAGGPMIYDSTFQTQIGGYPQDALVQSNILHGRVWRSTVDNNMTNPDDQTGAVVSWSVQPGTMAAGQLIPTYSPVATMATPAVYADGGTVGDASSNGTRRAAADAYWLFSYLWNNCASCGIFNSAGGGSSKTTMAADWAAHKQMATPDLRGTAAMGADNGGSTRLSSAPVVSGTTTTAGSIVGENTHVLVSPAELPAHFHQAGISDPTHYHSAGISDPGHFHQAVPYDPGHNHGVVDAVSMVTGNYTGSGVGGGGAFGPFQSPSCCFSIGTGYTGFHINSNHGLDYTYSVATGVLVNGGSNGNNLTYSAATGVLVNGGANGNNNTYSTGSSGAHNVVNRSTTVYWFLAL